ncbi:hypothetical protein GCM10023331_22720 [Algivirga pacifica]|uniref:PH domain-containing protein n=2 Tax=Algivirga pacifica TaxID=1162670 RepID=A0ABP9DC36_9BACT
MLVALTEVEQILLKGSHLVFKRKHIFGNDQQNIPIADISNIQVVEKYERVKNKSGIRKTRTIYKAVIYWDDDQYIFFDSTSSDEKKWAITQLKEIILLAKRTEKGSVYHKVD